MVRKIVGRRFCTVHTLKTYEKLVLRRIHVTLWLYGVSCRRETNNRFEMRFNSTVFHRRTTTLIKTNGVRTRYRLIIDKSAALRCALRCRTLPYTYIIQHYRTTLPVNDSIPPLEVSAVGHFSSFYKCSDGGAGGPSPISLVSPPTSMFSSST